MFILRAFDGNKFTTLEISNNPNRFPDNTLALGTINPFYSEIMWLYDNDEEFFTLACLRQHLKAKDVRLIMPYVPHARMDRTEDGEVFTLKIFCNLINNLNFSEVIIADPHSNVTTALLDRVVILDSGYYIEGALDSIADTVPYPEDNIIFFYPDEGAMKRYSKRFLSIPYAFGMKNRDWKTGKINGLTIVNGDLVKDKTVLIIDDICSRGGTFYHSSKALHNAGAKSIYLYVTHCEDTVFKGDMYSEDLVKQIYTTDSKLRNIEDKKIEIVYSFAKEFKNGKGF